jgi:hypothetical protein
MAALYFFCRARAFNVGTILGSYFSHPAQKVCALSVRAVEADLGVVLLPQPKVVSAMVVRLELEEADVIGNAFREPAGHSIGLLIPVLLNDMHHRAGSLAIQLLLEPYSNIGTSPAKIEILIEPPLKRRQTRRRNRLQSWHSGDSRFTMDSMARSA